MIQASPYPLLIAPRNHAGDLPDSVKIRRHSAQEAEKIHEEAQEKWQNEK